MARVAEQKATPVAQAVGHAPMHAEVRHPTQIVQPGRLPNSRINQRRQRPLVRTLGQVVFVAVDENKPAILRQRRNSTNPPGPTMTRPWSPGGASVTLTSATK